MNNRYRTGETWRAELPTSSGLFGPPLRKGASTVILYSISPSDTESIAKWP